MSAEFSPNPTISVTTQIECPEGRIIHAGESGNMFEPEVAALVRDVSSVTGELVRITCSVDDCLYTCIPEKYGRKIVATKMSGECAISIDRRNGSS